MARNQWFDSSSPRAGFLAVFTGVAILFAGDLVKEAYDNYGSRPVPATIQSVSVVSRTGSHGRSRYEPLIDFAYRANGVDYESSRYSAAGARKDSEESARARAHAYTVGARVTAYIPPSGPENAFLRREVAWYRYWRLLVVVSVGIALQLTVFSDKSLKIGRYAPKDAAS